MSLQPVAKSDEDASRFRTAVQIAAPLRPPAQLCSHCQKLVDCLSLGSRQTVNHHEDWNALKSSADSGCGFCSQFILGFESMPTPSAARMRPVERGNVTIYHTFYNDQDTCDTLVLEIPCTKGQLRRDLGYEAVERMMEEGRFLVSVPRQPALQQGTQCPVLIYSSWNSPQS